ncbi:uncharacterized protein VTP21DRAFT_10228 [Calcarisporiella thermophila]
MFLKLTFLPAVYMVNIYGTRIDIQNESSETLILQNLNAVCLIKLGNSHL